MLSSWLLSRLVAVNQLTLVLLHNSDCDTDMGLQCFERSELEPVPGCEGTGISGHNYCYMPDIPFVDEGDTPTNYYPLSRCQGDCDNDS